MDKATLYDWNGGNIWLFQQVNSVRGGAAYDQAMIAISRLADYHNFAWYIAIILMYALLALVVRKIRGRGGDRHYLSAWLGVFIVLGAGFAAEAVAIKSLKEHFAYPRPYAALPSGTVYVLEDRGAEDSHHSFPSGHTAFATLMVMALWPVLPGLARLFGALAIVLVMWSRMSMGMHFPADVLASFLIMVALVGLIRRICYMLLRKCFHLHC